MGLDMGHFVILSSSHAPNRNNLVDQLRFKVFGPVTGDTAPAKTIEIGKGRMRPNCNAIPFCVSNRTLDNHRIAGVKAARYVGRGYNLQHSCVIPNFIRTKTLTHVTIQIEGSNQHVCPYFLFILLEQDAW